jgi:hypothetical protein
MPFNQSRNVFQIMHNQGYKIGRLIRHDYFHVLLRLKPWKTLSMMLLLWTLIIVAFGGFYMSVDDSKPGSNCGLGLKGAPVTYATAFAFSLQTCTTTGYT